MKTLITSLALTLALSASAGASAPKCSTPLTGCSKANSALTKTTLKKASKQSQGKSKKKRSPRFHCILPS